MSYEVERFASSLNGSAPVLSSNAQNIPVPDRMHLGQGPGCSQHSLVLHSLEYRPVRLTDVRFYA
jgi:hypothetical protein